MSLKQISNCEVHDVFSKGEFKGILFIKFKQMSSIFDVARQLHMLKLLTPDDKHIRFDVARPLHIRTQRSFLVKVRQLLTDWEFHAQSLYLDDAVCALYCGNQLVLSTEGTCVKDFKCVFGTDDDWSSFL